MRGRWILLLILSLIGATGLTAETTEERFVSGLVARRLFPLAELACQNHLADAALSQREQAAWTVELIRIPGQHASHSLSDEQAVRWQEAHEKAQTFLAKFPQHSRKTLIEL